MFYYIIMLVRVVGKEPMSWELQFGFLQQMVECLKFADCEPGIVLLISLLINV